MSVNRWLQTGLLISKPSEHRVYGDNDSGVKRHQADFVRPLRTELDFAPPAMVSVLSADPSQSHSHRWIIDMPKV